MINYECLIQSEWFHIRSDVPAALHDVHKISGPLYNLSWCWSVEHRTDITRRPGCGVRYLFDGHGPMNLALGCAGSACPLLHTKLRGRE